MLGIFPLVSQGRGFGLGGSIPDTRACAIAQVSLARDFAGANLFPAHGICLLPFSFSAKPEDFFIAPVQGAAPSRTTAVAHPRADLPDFTTDCPAAAGIVEDCLHFFIPVKPFPYYYG
ncbi:unnamed protein product [Protopolystoma xenopodis]|uniref:Uncharacterized protein n=1 Tax=Protopolystoma xenopodis TaxID=117903 RepID=A0A448X702_9PLAT|nr:unnamed protein product [Protopolystoma xenopodis]